MSIQKDVGSIVRRSSVDCEVDYTTATVFRNQSDCRRRYELNYTGWLCFAYTKAESGPQSWF